MNVATITAQGRLSTSVALTYTTTGRPQAYFDVAVNHRRRNVGGEWEDAPTTFLTVRAFGRLAENIATLAKGAAVLIVGDLVTDEWTARGSGEKRRKTKVLASAGGPDYSAGQVAGETPVSVEAQ